MKTSASDPRIDRLYELLPAVYRSRDTAQGQALQALLRVIAGQVNVIEDDIQQMFENWFIETAEDWAVPYIADLIGYRSVSEAGPAGDDEGSKSRALNRVLVPRVEVANTIRYRRRKGSLALLELLANDIAGWPARAVEFYKLLGWNQNINHLHRRRAQTADLRWVDRLDLLDGPFDSLSHTVDVRRIDSHRAMGRYNIPSVGLFVWRLKPYAVTRSRPHCAEDVHPNCYTFSVLGQDARLFVRPEPEEEPTHIAEEMNLPVPIRRHAFNEDPGKFYGVGKSFAIWVEGWAGFDPKVPVPVEAIIPADLSGWYYAPPPRHIAVDPVLGRFAFPLDQELMPKKGVRVTYHYAFSADIGGGEYDRRISDPSPREVRLTEPHDPSVPDSQLIEPKFYRVGERETLRHLRDAIDHWREEKPLDAVIEVSDSGVYVEPINIRLNAGQTLQLRAANGSRPVIRLLDWQTDMPDALTVTVCGDSRFTLDGLLVMGRPVHINGPARDNPADPYDPNCGAHVVIRHCTLVPGWELTCDCEPSRPAEPSLELFNLRANVRIEHSILGAIQIHEDEVMDDPIPLAIADSIIDATAPEREAIGSPGYAFAHAAVKMWRCTVFGIVDVHAIELAENSIFNDCVNVARRQVGCMRFCYVPYGCRTPRRYHCQPDLVSRASDDELRANALRKRLPAPTQAELDSVRMLERLRVRPQFNNKRYGTPAYCQLADTCAEEIVRGADDESEMGAFHDLFQPQREANLRARLEEYTPAGMEAGVVHAT